MLMYLLPPLPYAPDALRPVIGEETMHTHHGKHHARYVHVVNVLLGDRAGASALEDVIVEAASAAISGYSTTRHRLGITRSSGNPWRPSRLRRQRRYRRHRLPLRQSRRIEDLFVAEGAAHFGSGWVWLMASKGKLEVVSTHDAEQPWLDTSGTPLLVCDLWEHAYYLDYKNERDRFLRAWFDRLANWDFAAAQHAAAMRGDGGYRYPLAGKVSGSAAAHTSSRLSPDDRTRRSVTMRFIGMSCGCGWIVSSSESSYPTPMQKGRGVSAASVRS